MSGPAEQSQFLKLASRDEAVARFQKYLSLQPLGIESVELSQSLDRVLAQDVIANIDIPGFDRSNMDGFAVCSQDVAGASERELKTLLLNTEVITPGLLPIQEVQSGTASVIATGGALPRGADAVVPVEETSVQQNEDRQFVSISRSVMPGESVSFAGSDIAIGETVLRKGQRLTSRELGVLAALGRTSVDVFTQPRVAIISTGDEIVPPGQPLPVGSVYDSNAAILSAAVRELGGTSKLYLPIKDDRDQLRSVLADAIENCDIVILSGGTSKGEGDLSYHAVSELNNPGILVHGVTLKPGKPVCLAVTNKKPVVVLPGFPTSAVFTFHEFVAPIVRAFGGHPEAERKTIPAKLAWKLNSSRGRTEFLLVNLIEANDSLVAYPLGKGSGSVTTFSSADGFIKIDQHTEMLEAGAVCEVTLISPELKPADLTVIGSHCRGLDILLGALQERGYSTKAFHVGSEAGVRAAKRGECDIAPSHLLDSQTNRYNEHLLEEGIKLVSGYLRMQSFVCRPDDDRFQFPQGSIDQAGLLKQIRMAKNAVMVNRNTGSGTRMLIDQLLQGDQPVGYTNQPKTHQAVCAAIKQNRADWGIAIDTVARDYRLRCIPLKQEQYDFFIPKERLNRPAVQEFLRLLKEKTIRQQLREVGFEPC